MNSIPWRQHQGSQHYDNNNTSPSARDMDDEPLDFDDRLIMREILSTKSKITHLVHAPLFPDVSGNEDLPLYLIRNHSHSIVSGTYPGLIS